MATAKNIIDALYGITFSGTAHTKEQRFQLHDTEYLTFTSFPLIVVVDGVEDVTGNANRATESVYRPTVHFFAEDETASNMLTWRESIENAILQSATVWGYAMSVMVNTITPEEPENRKLQHLRFDLEIVFDKTYTIS